MTSILDSAVSIEICVEPRYFEDAYVNGVKESVDQPTIFGFDGDDRWCVSIDLETGCIDNWSPNQNAVVHYKVCDQGEYWLCDSEMDRIAKWNGEYVPSQFLCHGDDSEGWGDYIIMSIDTDGMIKSYIAPKIDPSEWDII